MSGCRVGAESTNCEKTDELTKEKAKVMKLEPWLKRKQKELESINPRAKDVEQ